MFKQTMSLQVFYRLSFTNFTWPILKYFVPYRLQPSKGNRQEVVLISFMVSIIKVTANSIF